MHKARAALAISLGGAAESLADWRFRHRNQRAERVSRA
jgi:hypothetical protein